MSAGVTSNNQPSSSIGEYGLNGSVVSHGKIHRHHTPAFCGTLPNIVAVKRFCAALECHDWNRNQHIYHLRCQRNQRVSVRSERRETYYALATAILANCDYNPDSEYLFEVMCSVEELARLVGQLHVDASGRKTYDPVLHTLRDWKEAGLIVVLKGQDPESRQQKAMRVWLKPAFFDGLGFSVDELRSVVTRFRVWMERKGLRETYRTRYAEHVLRVARSNVASIEDKHSLKNLLKKIKRLVLGEDDRLQGEKKCLFSDVEKKLRDTERALAASSPKPDARPFYTLYTQWSTQQPRFIVVPLEASVRAAHPALTGEPLYRLLLERIRQDGL